MRIRRTSFPPSEAWIVDIRLGEVSSVVEEANGFLICKLKNKDTIPLNRAQVELRANLDSQRMREKMAEILASATATFGEAYFRRGRPTTPTATENGPAKPASEPCSRGK